VFILGGTWRMSVLVLDGFWFDRQNFGGFVQPGLLTHQGQIGDNPPSLKFDIASALILLVGGNGTVLLEDAVLNENTFPPTLSAELQ
jgi:hypothetical protein